MKISTKARYGVRTLIDVALHQGERQVPLKDIAGRQQITLPYLEQIVPSLVKAGFLRSIRGPSGGVRLAKCSENIRISEVIEAMDGSMAPVDCVDDPGSCERSDQCVTCDVWNRLKEAVDGVLESVTLRSLAERQKDKLRANRDT